MVTTIWLLSVLCFTFAGLSVGSRKGRPVLGALLGFFFGLIGFIIILAIPAANRTRPLPMVGRPQNGPTAQCPACYGFVAPGAGSCQRCGFEFGYLSRPVGSQMVVPPPPQVTNPTGVVGGPFTDLPPVPPPPGLSPTMSDDELPAWYRSSRD